MTKFIFPPRPRGRMNPAGLAFYELTGNWLAQRKFDDIRCLLHIEPGYEMSIWSRHGNPHGGFCLTRDLQEEIKRNLRLDPGLEYWIDGGITVPDGGGESRLVFWDILHLGCSFHAGPDQLTRIKILTEICGNPTQHDCTGIALQISEHLWLAESFERNFVRRFTESFNDHRLEGLVLRRKYSKLTDTGACYYEVDWLMRCRKPKRSFTRRVASFAGATGSLLLQIKDYGLRRSSSSMPVTLAAWLQIAQWLANLEFSLP
jgi:hypothetical protein